MVSTAQRGLVYGGRGSVTDVVRLGVLAACLRNGAFPAGAWAGLAGKLRPGLALGLPLGLGEPLGPGLGLPDGLGELDGLGLGLGFPPWLGGHLALANAMAAKMPCPWL